MKKIKLILDGSEYDLLEDVFSAAIEHVRQCDRDFKSLGDFRRLLEDIRFQELCERVFNTVNQKNGLPEKIN